MHSHTHKLAHSLWILWILWLLAAKVWLLWHIMLVFAHLHWVVLEHLTLCSPLWSRLATPTTTYCRFYAPQGLVCCLDFSTGVGKFMKKVQELQLFEQRVSVRGFVYASVCALVLVVCHGACDKHILRPTWQRLKHPVRPWGDNVLQEMKNEKESTKWKFAI